MCVWTTESLAAATHRYFAIHVSAFMDCLQQCKGFALPSLAFVWSPREGASEQHAPSTTASTKTQGDTAPTANRSELHYNSTQCVYVCGAKFRCGNISAFYPLAKQK
eukprot:INCI11606.1.p2 GENE.INCI11606.1~~INCI11606.1.p2  ORF type:complete len:107 (+),score=7.47 INCI11606.1:125-445(+)